MDDGPVVAVLHELAVAVVEAATVEAGDDVVAEADVVAVVEFDAVAFDFARDDAVEPRPGVCDATSPDIALARLNEFTDATGLAFTPDSGNAALTFMPATS